MVIFTRGKSLVFTGILFSVLSTSVTAAGLMQTVNPELMAFINSAVSASPQVIAARARFEASQSRQLAADRPLFNPQIAIDAENAETESGSVGISQTIDWANRREARSDVALKVSEAAKANFLAIRRQVTGELLSGLSAYQTSKAREELTLQRVAIMKDFASLSQRRFEQGDLNQVELSVASLAYMEARISHADLQVEVANAIAQVVNIEPRVPVENWPGLETLQALPKLDNKVLATQLPTVLVAKRNADAALARIELQKRFKKPSPTISLRAGKEESDSLLGINLSIPLYIRNNFQEQVNAASSDYLAAQQVADNVLRRSYSQLENAALRYNLYYTAWNDWQSTGLVDLNNQTQQLQQLWEAGEISTTEFLLQVQQTLDTRNSALILYQNVWQAWLQWLMASGKIDDWLEMEQPK